MERDEEMRKVSRTVEGMGSGCMMKGINYTGWDDGAIKR